MFEDSSHFFFVLWRNLESEPWFRFGGKQATSFFLAISPFNTLRREWKFRQAVAIVSHTLGFRKDSWSEDNTCVED